MSQAGIGNWFDTLSYRYGNVCFRVAHNTDVVIVNQTAALSYGHSTLMILYDLFLIIIRNDQDDKPRL